MVRHAALIAACMAVAGLSAAPAAGQEIGVIASLDPNLTGTPPGQGARSLTLGNKVVANEEITSTATGRGQLLFVDETTLSIAPNSRVVLDSFVYDPASREGSFSLRLTKGALRFIGGQTTRTREATIRTPSATIGIRGSTVLVSYENGRTTAVFMMGDRMCVEAGGGRSCTSRRGAVIGNDGYEGTIEPDQLGRFLSAIDGPPAQALTRQGTLGTDTAASAPADGDPISTRGTRRNFEALDRQGRLASGLGVFPDIAESGFAFAARGPDGSIIRPEGAVGCPSQGKGGTGSGGAGGGGGSGVGTCGLGADRGNKGGGGRKP